MLSGEGLSERNKERLKFFSSIVCIILALLRPTVNTYEREQDQLYFYLVKIHRCVTLNAWFKLMLCIEPH